MKHLAYFIEDIRETKKYFEDFFISSNDGHVNHFYDQESFVVSADLRESNGITEKSFCDD